MLLQIHGFGSVEVRKICLFFLKWYCGKKSVNLYHKTNLSYELYYFNSNGCVAVLSGHDGVLYFFKSM